MSHFIFLIMYNFYFLYKFQIFYLKKSSSIYNNTNIINTSFVFHYIRTMIIKFKFPS